MKKTIKTALLGMGLGLSIFALIGVVFDVMYHGNYALANWQYTKMAVGSMLVGIGFSLPSLVYDSKRLSFGLKLLIHMGIGCTIMLAVAFYVGWIPLEAGWKMTVLVVACEMVMAFIIWLAFYAHYKRLAKQMNRKIRKKDAE